MSAAASGLHPVAELAAGCIVAGADGSLREDPARLDALQQELERLADSEELEHAVRSVVAVAMTVHEDLEATESGLRILEVAEAMAPALRRRNGEPDRTERQVLAYRFMGARNVLSPSPAESKRGVALSSLYAPRVLSGR